MIIERISVSNIELNTGIDVVKDITPVALTRLDAEHNSKPYVPTEINVKNNSGVAVDFTFMSDIEYAKYLETPSFSDKITIAAGNMMEFSPTMDKVTKIIAKGTTGHTGNLDFIIVKE